MKRWLLLQIYLLGYSGWHLPRALRKGLARTALHRAWLCGHLGCFCEQGLRYGPANPYGRRFHDLSAACVALFLASQPLLAKDLGVHGPLFEIAEPSILETIKTRLREMERSGAMDEMRQEMQDTTRAYVNRPRPVLGLGKAEVAASWEVDLSITLERDLADHNGVVFARAGTVVNPLGFSRFNKRIVIFDGDDPAQVAFALSEGDELNTLLVLTNGDPLDLMRKHGRRFYFDQNAVLVDRFGVQNTPAVVRRADPVMIVEDVPLEASDDPDR